MNVSLLGIRKQILAVALLCTLPIYTFAQANNINYTNDYPSVERVKAEILGTDPPLPLPARSLSSTYLYAQINRIK